MTETNMLVAGDGQTGISKSSADDSGFWALRSIYGKLTHGLGTNIFTFRLMPQAGIIASLDMDQPGQALLR